MKGTTVANTGIDWSKYVRVTSDGTHVQLRKSCLYDWEDEYSYPLDEAEDLADYIKRLVPEARRNAPEVRQLVSDLECSAEDNPDATIEDTALYLIQRGYRKVSE
jgi:hypothetical protein